MRRLLLASTALIGLIWAPSPAAADPISIAITVAAGIAQGASLAIIAGTIALQVGLSLVGQALQKKPKQPDLSSFRASLRDRTVLVRQPVTSQKLIYGRARASGTLVYVQSTESNSYLHLVVAVAGHQIESIGDVYLDDKISTDPKYSGLVRIEKFLGAPDQAASADLIAESGGKWTSAHRLRGIPYLYLRLKWDENVWTNGIPSVKADIDGANEVEDPRETGSPTVRSFTRNNALLIRHYLKDVRYGLGCPDDEIDDDYFIPAANICAEQVEKAGGSPTEFEDRYSCDGVIDTANSPQDILRELLTSCGGRLVWSGGKWRLYVAAWDAPSLTFDEGDLVAPISVKTRVSAREAFSAIKGVYVAPENAWQPADYPAIKSETQRQALGLVDHRYKDNDLPFTISPSAAQRLAKIELLKAQQPITVDAVFNLSAMRCQAGDTIRLNNERFGWSQKAFEVIEWALAIQQDQAGSPALVVPVKLRETVSTIYDWSTSEEQTVDDAPNTDLPDTFNVANPTGLALQSGTAQLYTRLDGTIFSRIRASWTAPTDALVTRGGRIQGQVRGPLGESPAPPWRDAFDIDGSETEAFILDVQDGQEYEVRARSKNVIRAFKRDEANQPVWVSETHTVVGKTEPPSDVTGFSVQQNGNDLTFKWSQVPDRDLAGYEIRYMAAPFVWGNAAVITSVTRGTGITNNIVPPGDWVIGIKARDTSENYSTNPATFEIEVTNSNDIIFNSTQAPRWPGTMAGFLRHDVSGYLLPNGTVLASNMTDAELWDQFNAYPVAEARYTAPIKDVGFDAMQLRAYADMDAELGPGEDAALYVADPQLELDYRLSAGTFDGYEPWGIGYIDARYGLFRAVINTSTGKAMLKQFRPTMDVEEISVAIDQEVAAGGSEIVFSPRFHLTPRPRLTAEAPGSPPEGRIVGWTYLDAERGVFHAFNPAGASVGGTIKGDVTGA